jgi:hypothetical protein
MVYLSKLKRCMKKGTWVMYWRSHDCIHTVATLGQPNSTYQNCVENEQNTLHPNILSYCIAVRLLVDQNQEDKI